jgi:hypothetical protein
MKELDFTPAERQLRPWVNQLTPGLQAELACRAALYRACLGMRNMSKHIVALLRARYKLSPEEQQVSKTIVSLTLAELAALPTKQPEDNRYVIEAALNRLDDGAVLAFFTTDEVAALQAARTIKGGNA